MAVSLLRYANREAVAQALTERGYTVSRATVNRWAGGKEMPEVAGRMIAELFGHRHEEAAPPEWAERLVAEVESIRRVVESNAEELAALQAVLVSMQTLLGPGGDDPVDDPAPPVTSHRRGR